MSKKKDNTTYSASIEENLLGLTTLEELNTEEQKGVLEVEDYLLDLDENVLLSAELIKKLHFKAFGKIYDWAGRYRTEKVLVGTHTPPIYYQINELMEQYVGNIQFRLDAVKTEDDLVDLLAYVHHQILYIHPFKNGNGRAARFITNLVALIKGYQFIEIYVRDGDSRDYYIDAVRTGDKGDYSKLKSIIQAGLKKL